MPSDLPTPSISVLVHPVIKYRGSNVGRRQGLEGRGPLGRENEELVFSGDRVQFRKVKNWGDG